MMKKATVYLLAVTLLAGAVVAGESVLSLRAKQDINSIKARPIITNTRREHWTTLTNKVHAIFSVLPPYTAQQAALLEPALSRRAARARADIKSASDVAEIKDAVSRLADVQAIQAADSRLRTYSDYRLETEHRKQKR